MGTVVLVRHGETNWNAERRIQGWAPSPLNEEGRRQARALGEHVATRYGVDRIVSSDLRRTTETTRELRRSLPDADVEFSRAWRERDFGVLQGLAYRELFEGYPEFSVRKSGYPAAAARPEGGESWQDVYDRIRDAWTELVDELDEAETVLIVTHGGPIHVVIGLLKGYDVAETIAEIDLGNCALTEVGVDADERDSPTPDSRDRQDADGELTLRRECVATFLDDEQ